MKTGKIRTDVDILLCASLYMGSVELFRKLLGLLWLHLSGWSVRKSGGVGNESSAVTAPRRPQKRTVAGFVVRRVRVEDSPVLEVDLGPDYYTRNGVLAAEVDNLVVDDLNHVERLVVCHGVDENEAMDTNGMLGVEDGVLILAESVGRWFWRWGR